MESVESIYKYAWIIPVLPLFGAAVVGTGLISYNEATNKLKKPVATFIVSLIGTAMALSIMILVSQLQGHAPHTYLIEWASAGDFTIDMGFTIDHITSLMLVIVTTVAFLVMIYTDGYMSHDPSYVRFYAYLSLFSSSMLGLVMSPNLLQVYVFWELVGMCSYLLIGYWYDRDGAADACQKAFVTNRVGDFGLLLGMLGLFWATGTFEFELMGDRLSDLVTTGVISGGLAALFAGLVFMGPMAKSAQFPLHVWLPDAMEGPTPISALIHAATMVAAGVFLIARMYPVFENIPSVMSIIAWTGAITAFVGASIAITQNDIKKGLAFSTMSQLGYMGIAMGVGAYTAGLFQLMTHAYFKAMLFLGSGSVIHGMEEVVGHDPALAQDMRLMGGLRKYMPITAITFLIGTLAISGLPPFAGFWSKDEILGAVFEVNPVMWAIGWITAGATAFYMFRMYFSTFEGEFRGNDADIRKRVKVQSLQMAGASMGPGAMSAQELAVESADHEDHPHAEKPHESVLSMTFPLMMLAIPSALIGLVGTPFANYFEAFIYPSGEALTVAEIAEEFDVDEFVRMAGLSVAISVAGIILAVLMYRTKTISAEAIANKIKPLYNFSLNKWYIDDLYREVFIKGTRRLAKGVLNVDVKIVDGIVNFTGFFTLVTGEGLKYFENGRAQFYTLIVFGAVLGLIFLSGLN